MVETMRELVSIESASGAHANDAEFVDLNSVEPRLYLLTRMIMDVARDAARGH
jgi:hypothetical protein